MLSRWNGVNNLKRFAGLKSSTVHFNRILYVAFMGRIDYNCLMKTHRFVIILFFVGLLVFCASNFLMQKRFDVLTLSGAAMYVLGIITGIVGYQSARRKKRKEDLIDSLP